MSRIFAIGDLHGCNATFKRMLFEELQIQKEDEIYCLGDYIDRGNDSKGVIDTIISLKEDGYKIHTLRGNHEQMMIESVQDYESFHNWIANGGDATLKSFKINSVTELSFEYRRFFIETKYFVNTPYYIFVHGGLNFNEENIFVDKEAMLWIRDFDNYQPVLGNKILIHGHTPQTKEYIFNQNGNCINIDGGCVYKDIKGYGNLFALNLTEKKLISIRNID